MPTSLHVKTKFTRGAAKIQIELIRAEDCNPNNLLTTTMFVRYHYIVAAARGNRSTNTLFLLEQLETRALASECPVVQSSANISSIWILAAPLVNLVITYGLVAIM